MDIPPPYSESSFSLTPTSPGTPESAPVSSTSPNNPNSWPTTQDVSSPSRSSSSPSADLPSPSTSTALVLQPGFKPPQAPPANVQRTSCVRLRQENWMLKGQYVLDPYLPIPEDVRAMSADLVPKNMSLVCQNGNINAEVWIVGGEEAVLAGADSGRIKKTLLEAQGQNGFVTVRVVSARVLSAFFQHSRTHCAPSIRLECRPSSPLRLESQRSKRRSYRRPPILLLWPTDNYHSKRMGLHHICTSRQCNDVL